MPRIARKRKADATLVRYSTSSVELITLDGCGPVPSDIQPRVSGSIIRVRPVLGDTAEDVVRVRQRLRDLGALSVKSTPLVLARTAETSDAVVDYRTPREFAMEMIDSLEAQRGKAFVAALRARASDVLAEVGL